MIICAAVRVISPKFKNKVWKGHRHNHAIAAMHDELSYTQNRKQISKLKIEQGFVTSKNKFVSRPVALKLAVKSGQVKLSKAIMPQHGLDSSDLY